MSANSVQDLINALEDNQVKLISYYTLLLTSFITKDTTTVEFESEWTY